MAYYKNGNFTIENVEKHLGYPLKKTGHNQYQGTCPYCQEEGHDTSGDNLHFNPNKGFFCGACIDNEHGKKLAQEIVKINKENYKTYQNTSVLGYSANDVEQYQKELFSDKQMLDLLIDTTNLTEEVIKEVKIGFSHKCNVFTLPMISLDGTITGLEFRTPENQKGKFKFLCKTKGFAEDETKLLSKINNVEHPKELFICAGYKDGYAVLQDLKNHGREKEVQIVTNTNGEPNTAKALEPHIEYLKTFDKVVICLDNDKPGKAALKKVEQTIPVIFEVLNLARLNGVEKYINDYNDLLKYKNEYKITEDIAKENTSLSLNSLLKIYIKNPNTKLNQTKQVKIKPEHSSKIGFIETGIYPYKNNYYLIRFDKEENELIYVRKSNFTIDITRKIIAQSLSFGQQSEYKIELTTHIGNKTTVPQVLTQKELLDHKNLHEILKGTEIHINTLTDVELKNIILDELNQINEELHIYKNPSLIEHKSEPYWLYKNALINLTNDNIYISKDKTKDLIQIDSKDSVALRVDRGMFAPELYLPDLSYEEFVRKNYNDELITEFSKTAKTIPQLLAQCLFANTLRTYNKKPEAFLALGIALMSPYVDILFAKTMGFPIGCMYGEAASGKSNLLQTLAYIFGFDSRFLSSGNDTSTNVLHNMEYYKNIPLLHSEIEGYLRKNFEPIVKAVYDRNPRKKMTAYAKDQDVKAVNATLHFATNDRAHRNPQTATRLVYTEFKKDDFSVEEASKLNNIREKYLSCILPEILKSYKKPNHIHADLKLVIKRVCKLNPTLDLRFVNNVAIAMLGMDYLYYLANFDASFRQSEELKVLLANIENYVKSLQDLTHTEDVFEKFLRIFLPLAKSGRIQYGSEYVFNEKKKELSIYVNGVYQLFKKEFKQSEDNGVPIPDEKDITNQALKRPYIEKKSKNFGKKKSNRALVITIPETEETLLYILKELVSYQEDLEARENQKDRPIETPYMKDKLEQITAI